jgi:glutathione S-transferase
MGRLPILEVDGKPIAQSKSIARFVAKKYGFTGADEVSQNALTHTSKFTNTCPH